MMNPETIVAEAVRTIHGDSAFVELRPLMPDGRWWTGLYDDRDRLVRSIVSLNDVEPTAVYWTLNQISPKLAERVTNRLAPARKSSCTKNADIERLRWIFLDIDLKGDPAAVVQLRDDVRQYLTTIGWDEPVSVHSGTGRYLLYRCDLPVSESPMIRQTVANLKARFDRPGAIIDPKCCNPARIARVPGSYNRKGSPRLAMIEP